jgi:hypothetical protein
MSKAKYRIQLGQYSGDVPTEVLSVLQQIGGVKPVKAFDGSTTYYSRQFNSKEERDAAMKEYEVYELEGMSEIIEYEGKYYTPEEFKKLQE